jgi:hydroxylaminobenzene mutase
MECSFHGLCPRAELGSILLAVGLWPRLNLGETTSRIAFWLLVYSAFVILAAYVMGSVWGAGNETMPLAAGTWERCKRL